MESHCNLMAGANSRLLPQQESVQSIGHFIDLGRGNHVEEWQCQHTVGDHFGDREIAAAVRLTAERRLQVDWGKVPSTLNTPHGHALPYPIAIAASESRLQAHDVSEPADPALEQVRRRKRELGTV